ncbi:MAG: DNA alkylation repair protein, partial [Chitinophagaceae bacterium]|nr:DNA alkylation repair protein [Chitinophagaceae bacterium]
KNNTLTSLTELDSIVQSCFEQPQREYQYFAVELISFHKKIWQPSVINTIEHCLVSKSWWDSVDHVASECLTDYFKLYPNKINSVTNRWNQSKNIWLQRSSIMFQKAFKANTNTELLSKYILNCASSKEFFVQKAIGWALREYSKTNGAWVKQFVATHQLAPLSKREALKRMDD